MPRQAEEVLQYEDFLSWTVSSLKDFLSLRGLGLTTEYRATFEGLSLLSGSSAPQSIPRYII